MPLYLENDADRFFELLAALIRQALKDSEQGDPAARQWVSGGDLNALLQLCGLDLTAQYILRSSGAENTDRRRAVRKRSRGSASEIAVDTNYEALAEAERKARAQRLWVMTGGGLAEFEIEWPALREMLSNPLV